MGFKDYIEPKTEQKKKVNCEVKKVFGIISESEKETKEIRLVSWNGGSDKFDIRKWTTKDGEEKAGSGIVLTVEEIQSLYNILRSMQEE